MDISKEELKEIIVQALKEATCPFCVTRNYDGANSYYHNCNGGTVTNSAACWGQCLCICGKAKQVTTQGPESNLAEMIKSPT